jgi:hypothetical protein
MNAGERKARRVARAIHADLTRTKQELADAREQLRVFETYRSRLVSAFIARGDWARAMKAPLERILRQPGIVEQVGKLTSAEAWRALNSEPTEDAQTRNVERDARDALVERLARIDQEARAAGAELAQMSKALQERLDRGQVGA